VAIMKKKKKLIVILSLSLISLIIAAFALYKLYFFICDVAEAMTSVHGTWPSY
jgi:cytochrome c oxidase assembly protein Cox11